MLTDEEFRLFTSLVYEEAGIYLRETKKGFLENRLMKRMGATGMSSPYWYYKFATETKRAELLTFLDLLTVNETSFFRNRPQIELFANIVLPDVLKNMSCDTRKGLRIWSAGCATGEEPYTIAMVVNEVTGSRSFSSRLPAKESVYEDRTGTEDNRPDTRIFASDLSLSVLEIAIRGEYDINKVRATVPDEYLARYFEPAAERYRLKDEIRKMVVFDFHNLKNENGISDLDVIFCRNVMIYFDEDGQRRLVEKFYRSLNPGGYLLLGHAESLHGLDTEFEFVYDNKGTAYRKPVHEKRNGV